MQAAIDGDLDSVVQVNACRTLASLARQDPGQFRARALKSATTFFRQYGTGCVRSDKDWGWRIVGNTLKDYFETEGKAALDQLMQQKEDQQLADLAWRVVYLKQEDGFTPITEEQEREAHLKHPFLRFDFSGKTK